LRLGFPVRDISGPVEELAKAPIPPPSTASRFSSSCFSALIRADKIALISS
jgi:hypothetical protein